MEETKILDFDRDWKIIMDTQLTHIAEEKRDAYLNGLLRMAAYN